VEHQGKAPRPLLDVCKRGAKLGNEFRSKAFPFAVVPQRCLKGIEFRFRPNFQPAHLPNVAETLIHPFNDLLPRPRVVRRAPMGSKALIQQGLLPLLEGYLIDAGRDVVPERRHVIDPIIDRKRINSSGRQR
jgi:hypothetical protein